MAVIYKVNSSGAAHVLVYEVQTQNAADLSVCMVNSIGVAGNNDSLWYETTKRGAATSLIHFVSSPGAADLLVCFVSSTGAAGWQRNHRLKGKL